ncbi:hypothetical protein G6F66_013857 [Rhizopus arrhizus]|nr:hypothetical protein G6F31_017245 [Rhizopus arrhizus]KAG1270226.1 hypothetical protein G6F66_013857 [Rhizopus arrhizus]
MGRHDTVEPGTPAVVAAVRIDTGACAYLLHRFTEAVAVAVGDADLVRIAKLVFVDAGDMPAFDEVRHAADHVPGAHEALQVDRRVQSGRVGGAGRWRLAGGHGGARQRQGQQHGAERADRNHAGAGSSGLARAWSTVCTRSVNGVAVREKALAHAVLHCPPEKPHERTYRPSPCN